MTEGPNYCIAQLSRGSRFEQPEFCETEVDEPGDLCPVHEEDDRSDEAYDAYLENKWRERYL